MATMDTLMPLIYHETQQEGSMLCAQHALNSLLQGPYFSPADLSAIAERLDTMERDYDEGNRGQSTNMDDTGFFSVQVLEEALQVWNLTLVRWRSEDMRPFQDHPHTQLAFVLNQQEHWYTLRRFGPASPDPAADPGDGHWFNLNSILPQPEWISKMYLGMFLQQAETEGYSVFAVLQRDPSGPLALPRTEADEIASAIPEGSAPARTRDAPTSHHASSSIAGFEDEDMELQAALQASLMGGGGSAYEHPAYEQADHAYPAPVAAASQDPIFGSSGTRTPVQRAGYRVLARGQAQPALAVDQDEDVDIEDDDDDGEFVPPHAANRYAGLASDPVDPLAASRARSQAYMRQVMRQQEAALRESYAEEAARVDAGVAPRRNARAEQEEAELMRALEESRAMHEAIGSAPTRDDDDEEEEVRRDTPTGARFAGDRVYDDEDAELQAALKASLETLPEGYQAPATPPPARTPTLPVPAQPPAQTHGGEAEDDGFETESEADVSTAEEPEPQLSMEEIRRRRLAKFGG